MKADLLNGLSNNHAIFVAVALSLAFRASAYSVWPFASSFDLPALARKCRPAVVLIVVYDSAGEQVASGTGFVVSSDGVAVTNAHVIKAGISAVAKSEDGKVFRIDNAVGDDPKNDLVLLKLEGSGFQFLRLGSSSGLLVGEKIAIVGSPLGLEGTLSDGIVSAFRKEEDGRNLIQVTAPISHGSSGSPVLNAAGEVVGVATLVLQAGQSLNFAIPIEAVKAITQQRIGKSLVLESMALREGRKSDDPDYKAFTRAFDAQDLEKALEFLKEYLDRNEDDSQAHAELGLVYTRLQRYDQALAATQKAIELYPGNTYAWLGLGDIFTALDKYEEAIAAYKRAIKLDENGVGDALGLVTAGAWHKLTNIYSARGQQEEAAAAKEQELRAAKREQEIRASHGKRN